MLSRCANPGCGAPFRYLSEGKVFVAEWANEGDACELTDPAGPLNRPWGRREMFWLCGTCNRSVTLVAKGREVVTAVRGETLQPGGRLLSEIRITA